MKFKSILAIFVVTIGLNNPVEAADWSWNNICKTGKSAWNIVTSTNISLQNITSSAAIASGVYGGGKLLKSMRRFGTSRTKTFLGLVVTLPVSVAILKGCFDNTKDAIRKYNNQQNS